MNGLVIRWRSATHADVEPAPTDLRTPLDGRLLSRGESYYGIPFQHWAAHTGETVDVLHLQFDVEKSRAPQPPLAITARLGDEGWRSDDDAPVPAVPPGAEFGFSTGSRLVPCGRAQLIAQCVGAPETPRVWTPESPQLVPPERVPFLVDALRKERMGTARRSVEIAAVALAGSAAFAWQASIRSGWAMLFALAAAWFAVAFVELQRAQRSGPDAYAAARDEFRHDVWVASRRAIHTEILLLLLVLVALAQTFGLERSIAVAGLVKSAVREGESWRLLTGPLLHGGVLHLAMNGLALWSLGPLVEAHSRRAFLPLLFLVSAFCGSLLSLVLLPDATSVGASGGILGIAGYLLVLGYRRRRSLPAGFVQRLGIGILATAVFGLVGYAWVDNATHLGGMLGGVVMAFLPAAGPDASGDGARLRAFRPGQIALAVLALGAIIAVGAIYLDLTGGRVAVL